MEQKLPYDSIPLATEIEDSLEGLLSEINKMKAEKELLLKMKKEAEETLELLIRESEYIVEGRHALQEVALATQKQLRMSIEPIVTKALDIVFKEEAYRFVVDFEVKNNRTECSLFFEKGGLTFHPISSSGFGAVDVAAFALRLALWNISKPITRSTFVMDEPFKHVSEDLQESVMEMVHTLSSELGIQIILVTHTKESDTYEYSDKLFKVSLKDGRSHVRITKDAGAEK